MTPIDFYVAGNDVKRWHTSHTLQTQTLASHSWGVALLIGRLHPAPSANLLRAALEHDLHERKMGDMPHHAVTPARRIEEGMMQLELGLITPAHGTDEVWLNAADKVEAYLFSVREVEFGNASFGPIMESIERLIEDWNGKGLIPEPLWNFYLEVEL